MFGRLWVETGCRDVLRALLAGRRFGFDVERADLSHRAASTDGRPALTVMPAVGAAPIAVPGADRLTLEHAYKAMAWLGEETGQGRYITDAVEEALYRHRQSLFGELSVAFFDTTTLWFEGAGGTTLGRRGHSKDYRGQLNQVVLGIVLDDRDRPIASFLMPGNTADVAMLLPVVERLRLRFGVARACIVADRGMISADTIAALETERFDYILGVRERVSREVRREVIDDDGAAVPLAIPRQSGLTQLEVKEVSVAGRRYILCRNEERAKQDAQARAELIAGLERKLAQGDKALVANKGFRRFLETPPGDGFSIDRAKVEADARFDGVFVLRTSTKLSALQVVLRYRNLLAVEDAFKTAKALLATRPIFHKTDAGIRGHVFCTFLALVLRKELIDRLAAGRGKTLEWQRIIDDLAELSEIEIEQDGRRALLRTAPGPTIDPVCRALGLALPPVFQELPPAGTQAGAR